jgi:N-acyl-L-homoserine lactone synthetase
MRVVSGDQEELPCGVYVSVARYRHRIFVEQLGWQLQTHNGHEIDQFDRPDTVYVVAQDDEGRVFGCARLLPTTRPYLLGEIFPHLLNGLAPPCAPEVWELSRFSAVDLVGSATTPVGRFSSTVAIQLLQESLACAAGHGAKQVITVSPLGVERLLRAAGFTAHRAGPPIVVAGHPIFACIIDVGGS